MKSRLATTLSIAKAEATAKTAGRPLGKLNDSNPTRHALAPDLVPDIYSADPRGQRYAGQALGMQTWQTYRYVLMPMALRIILPPLTSESMNLVKNSAAAFAVSIAELTQYAMQVAEETSRPIEVYLAVTVLYIVTAFAINRILGFIEKRTRVPGLIAASRTPGGR